LYITINDAIKLKVETKFKTFFKQLLRGVGGVQNKSSFVNFRLQAATKTLFKINEKKRLNYKEKGK
jgi:hypothetical protein